MAITLYGYTWRHTRRAQLWMLVVVAVSIIPLFLSLNLPKLIVNGPIQGEGFEQVGATREYLRTAIPLPHWLSSAGELVVFPGIHFGRMEALYVLSGLFLALVIINGAFKYYINTYKGRLGERMLRRMRYEFVDLILRFPIGRFRQLRASELSSMVKDELEPIGGFIGDAVVTPVYLISQVLTAIVFIFIQSVSLGLVALGVMMIQVILIPRMRRRLLVLGRQRQLTARQFAGRVGEIVESISSIHANDTANYERAGVSEELGRIFLIRFDIYQWKFLVKFLNNFLAQLTPFIFYLFGGYFAITGHLDIGQLVAVIAAYKDLPSPLKDLIDWDQLRLDVQVKFEQVVEQFYIQNLSDAALTAPAPERVAALAGGFALAGAALTDENGGRVLDPVTLDLPLNQRVAAVGPIGEGGEAFAEMLVRLRSTTAGELSLGDRPLGAMPESVTGRRIAYVDAATYFPRTTLRQSLLYGLMHHPVTRHETTSSRKADLAALETKLSGNTALDIADDWIDYEDIGVAAPDGLGAYLGEILALVGLERDVRLFGLRSRVPEEHAVDDVEEHILAARRAFRESLAEAGMEDYVEPFDVERYIRNATIMENIVFGAPRDPRAGLAQLWINENTRAVVRETGLAERLYGIGRDIASNMIDLFGDLEPGNPLLQRMTVMTAEDLATYRQLLGRSGNEDFERAPDADRVAFIRLAFSYIETRDRLGLVDDEVMRNVVETRHLLRERLPKEMEEVLVFHDADRFNPATSVQDNVLFGRIATDLANAGDAVEGLLLKDLDELGLGGIVQEAGLTYDIGSGAKRLSLGQQQKLALARALTKAPDYLVVNRGLSALDGDSQSRIVGATLERAANGPRPFGAFWVVASARDAKLFERVLEFRDGRLVADETVGGGEMPDAVENPERHPEASPGAAETAAGSESAESKPVEAAKDRDAAEREEKTRSETPAAAE
ncbi:ABC transporter transmembrane domain-containing protein [Aureimonas leprariae]|uniref:ABC transporter ATP-binding protein n=1 Tax=Plantimonas leprariae TaxID=2615207 RepID=A0A7V7PMC2_9HYPH|nr:ABC transporter transmembrane domain-containing protein [Aureimonas leprariae]KAB0677766.1 ABC transporter ATP-binding protein [Aureimonas leprariae]